MAKYCYNSISPEDCVAQLRVKTVLINVLEEFSATTFLAKGLGRGGQHFFSAVLVTVY
jgi:hypothetical protein